MPCGCARNVISGPNRKHLAACRAAPHRRRRRLRGSAGPTPSPNAASPCREPRRPDARRAATPPAPRCSTGLLSNITSTSRSHAERHRIGVVHRDAQQRARDVVLVARQRTFDAGRRSSRPGDRCTGRPRCWPSVGRTAERHDHAALLGELLQLRQRLLGGDVAQRVAELGRDVLGARLATAERRHRPPPPPRSGMPPSGKSSTSYFALRLPASSACGYTTSNVELELLEDEAHPA